MIADSLMETHGGLVGGSHCGKCLPAALLFQDALNFFIELCTDAPAPGTFCQIAGNFRIPGIARNLPVFLPDQPGINRCMLQKTFPKFFLRWNRIFKTHSRVLHKGGIDFKDGRNVRQSCFTNRHFSHLRVDYNISFTEMHLKIQTFLIYSKEKGMSL